MDLLEDRITCCSRIRVDEFPSVLKTPPPPRGGFIQICKSLLGVPIGIGVDLDFPLFRCHLCQKPHEKPDHLVRNPA